MPADLASRRRARLKLKQVGREETRGNSGKVNTLAATIKGYPCVLEAAATYLYPPPPPRGGADTCGLTRRGRSGWGHSRDSSRLGAVQHSRARVPARSLPSRSILLGPEFSLRVVILRGGGGQWSQGVVYVALCHVKAPVDSGDGVRSPPVGCAEFRSSGPWN